MLQRFKTIQDLDAARKEHANNPATFWGKIAETFDWIVPFDQVTNADMDSARNEWFLNGKLNITINALDRHVEEGRGDEIALRSVPNNPDHPVQEYTYHTALEKVKAITASLRASGVEKGDRVCLYMPMGADLVLTMLGCARAGAVHSVVFAGFSAQALADRIEDAGAKVLITAQKVERGNKVVPLGDIAKEAYDKCSCLEKVVIAGVQETHDSLWETWSHWLTRGTDEDDSPEVMDSEDPLFILYTSGSTGKPKGVVHTCGGYMVYAQYSFINAFGYDRGDTFFCTADAGWITGHTYVAYGPFLAGAKQVIFEGVPTWPDSGRFWQIVEQEKVTHFYTAPTAIRALMACGNEWTEKHDLTTLKVLGTVGEPINVEAFEWYADRIGAGRCPIVDTWWQTETGGIVLTTVPNTEESIATVAGRPLPGVSVSIRKQDGTALENHDAEGYLCIDAPWPSMLRSTWGDHDRCVKTYFSQFKGRYFTGDGAHYTEDGRIRVSGRMDDVLNVSGHRLGTAEIEDAIDKVQGVIESAVVGVPHEIKGEAVVAFVIAESGIEETQVSQAVVSEIGAIARPERVFMVKDLPKTRSGKIMRRVLRKIAKGESESLGDISTLVNPEAVQAIIDTVVTA